LPDISAFNRPSYLLAAWIKLYEAGIAEQKIRLLPIVGPPSLPEVSQGPALGDPFERLHINVGAQYRRDWRENAGGVYQMGRLAHFQKPLLVGLEKGLETSERLALSELPKDYADADPLSRMVMELQKRYADELDSPKGDVNQVDMTALTARLLGLLRSAGGVRNDGWTSLPGEVRDEIVALIGLIRDKTGRGRFRETAERLIPLQNRHGSQPYRDLVQWNDLLFPQRRTEERDKRRSLLEFVKELSNNRNRLDAQIRLLEQFKTVVAWETPDNCTARIRELVEILTTEAFRAVIAFDALWGVSYLHGPPADWGSGQIARENSSVALQGAALTTVGGCDARTLLALMLRQWVEHRALLGIGPITQRDQYTGLVEGLDLTVFSDAEQKTLWTLVAWRREVSDPIVLLKVAVQSFLDAETQVFVRRYDHADAQLGSLYGQLRTPMREQATTQGKKHPTREVGGTAVLAGGLLAQPHVVLYVPLAHRDDIVDKKLEQKLAILTCLFLPLHLHYQVLSSKGDQDRSGNTLGPLPVEVVFQQKYAKLDGATYLNHPFQAAPSLAPKDRQSIGHYS